MDLGGEAEKAAVGVGVSIVSTTGQTVLLMGALQHVHGSVLQVGGLLHYLSIEDQVWGSWERNVVVRNIADQQKVKVPQ